MKLSIEVHRFDGNIFLISVEIIIYKNIKVLTEAVPENNVPIFPQHLLYYSLNLFQALYVCLFKV